jgi:transcriptional regulator with XRE-family HTH domain
MVHLYSMATIHDNIRQLRKSKGWTQAQLAQRLRTSQKVITSYETSRKTPPVSRLSALAALLNVSIEELIGAEPLKIKETLSHTHRNSRMARLQEFYEKLPPEEQRVILKQVKTLAGHGANHLPPSLNTTLICWQLQEREASIYLIIGST